MSKTNGFALPTYLGNPATAEQTTYRSQSSTLVSRLGTPIGVLHDNSGAVSEVDAQLMVVGLLSRGDSSARY